jgi:hypothetical protein
MAADVGARGEAAPFMVPIEALAAETGKNKYGSASSTINRFMADSCK